MTRPAISGPGVISGDCRAAAHAGERRGVSGPSRFGTVRHARRERPAHARSFLAGIHAESAGDIGRLDQDVCRYRIAACAGERPERGGYCVGRRCGGGALSGFGSGHRPGLAGRERWHSARTCTGPLAKAGGRLIPRMEEGRAGCPATAPRLRPGQGERPGQGSLAPSCGVHGSGGPCQPQAKECGAGCGRLSLLRHLPGRSSARSAHPCRRARRSHASAWPTGRRRKAPSSAAASTARSR